MLLSYDDPTDFAQQIIDERALSSDAVFEIGEVRFGHLRVGVVACGRFALKQLPAQNGEKTSDISVRFLT
jgi:hypothetical protein